MISAQVAQLSRELASAISLIRICALGASLCWLVPTPSNADTPFLNNQILIPGPIEVRFAFTDTNGKEQDLQIQQLSPAAFSGLPVPVQQIQTSPLLQAKYLSNLWSQISGNVCGDVSANVVAQINSKDNSAYNINCSTNPNGALIATRTTKWEDDTGHQVTGQRLILDYKIPLNYVTFYVTSPTTCHAGDPNPVCATDPQFTLVFDVDLMLVAQSPTGGTFWGGTLSLPLTVTNHEGSVTLDDLVGGDLGEAVKGAWKQFAINAEIGFSAGAVTGETVGAADVLAASAVFLAQVGSIGVSGEANKHLRDQISASLKLGSSTAGSAAATTAQYFGQLNQGLFPVVSVGFSNFDIVAGGDGGLIFRVTQPAAGKPVLVNTSAAASARPSLFGPTIGADERQMKAGSTLDVQGNYFKGSYTTHLDIGWTSTLGTINQTGEVEWGPQSKQAVQVTTPANSFQAAGLTPGTSYQFRARDCTVITCSPWSDWLIASTQAHGSDQVVLNLDNATVIGNALLNADGTFASKATIPSRAPAGQHKISAAAGTGTTAQQASMSIQVCAASGCSAVLSFVDPLTGASEANGRVRALQCEGHVLSVGTNYSRHA